MLYLPFKDFSEFSELFCEHFGTRKNKILLALYKSREMLKLGISQRVNNMQDLEKVLMDEIEARSIGEYNLSLMGRNFHSNVYKTDEKEGICEDFMPDKIRVVKHETNPVRDRLVRVKSGKLLRALILESDFGRQIPDECLTYLAEKYATAWTSWVQTQFPEYSLVVNDDFERIYDSESCPGDFGSCMVDDDQYKFYEYSVPDCKAAFIVNRDREVVARAILFTKVTDQDGNDWRLLERQYSRNGNDNLKRILVNKCIAEGYIDGYKTVGAGCHAASAFVDNDGNSLSRKRFRIRCTLRLTRYEGDPSCGEEVCSYQDSFKWYDSESETAYNYESAGYDALLDTTNSSVVREESNYDEYHERYTSNNTVGVYARDQYMQCDEDDLEDFTYNHWYGLWFHDDYYTCCPHCGERFFSGTPDHSGDGHYSELLDNEFCCPDCRDRAELEYKKENWYYSEYTEEYYETEEERNDAEEEYKKENLEYSDLLEEWFDDYDELVDAELRYMKEYWVYSDKLDKYFETDEELQAAESEAKHDDADDTMRESA